MPHHILIKSIILLVILYSAVTILVALRQKHYIFHPDRNVDATPADAGLPFEDLVLKTPDGETIRAWFVPAGQQHAPVILFCHGNGGDIGNRIESLEVFHAMGFSALVFDYRGYGASSGTPSEQGTYSDARTAWNYLTEARRIAPEDIIIYGRSLGGAIASRLATEVTPRGVVLESTFASIKAMAKAYFPLLPVTLFTRFHYNNLENIKKIHAPLLMCHSKTDRTCPYNQGCAVFNAANPPKQFIEITGGHNDLAFDTTPAYRTAFKNLAATGQLMPDGGVTSQE